GLPASTASRVYQSAFFALRDTRTPARVAGLRVAASAAGAAVLMTQFEPLDLGFATVPAGLFADASVQGLPLGAVGLALGAALGAWAEWALLSRRLRARIGPLGVGFGTLGPMLAAALAAAAAGH